MANIDCTTSSNANIAVKDNGETGIVNTNEMAQLAHKENFEFSYSRH